MHVNDSSRARALVQIVDVLGAQEKLAATLRESGFKASQRGMSGRGIDIIV